MVHGLATLDKLNREAAKKPAAHGGGNGIPKELLGNPVAIRAFRNRPWTRAELHGEKSVFETYAESAAAPFNGKNGQLEGIRRN